MFYIILSTIVHQFKITQRVLHVFNILFILQQLRSYDMKYLIIYCF